MDTSKDRDELRQDWALALMDKGVIVKLKVSRWTGSAPLTYDDIGFTFFNPETFEFMKKYIKLGNEKLIPHEIDKEIMCIVKRAYKNLSMYSYDTIWGKFVPYIVFDAWERENEIIRNEYLNAAETMGEKYDEIVSAIKENYKKLGQEVWSKIYQDGNVQASESFLENFTSKIANKIPSSEKIVTSFKYDHTYFTIPLPSFLEDNLLEAEKVQNARELEGIRHDNEKETLRLEKEAKKRIAQEYVSKKAAMVDSFLESTVISFRSSISEMCDNILVSLSRPNVKVSKASIDKIRKHIDNVRLLNFCNDHEITELLNNLENEVTKFKGERDNSVILRCMQTLADVAKKEFAPYDVNPILDCMDTP